MKDELGRKIMTKYVGLRVETYSNLIDNSSKDKKAKGIKKCVIERKFNFEKYQNYLEATQLENKICRLERKKINIDRLKKIHKKQ